MSARSAFLLFSTSTSAGTASLASGPMSARVMATATRNGTSFSFSASIKAATAFLASSGKSR
jgi:hypothetical protein